MQVHFVCTGNAYRSSLAEAYLRSKQIAGITASSSGVRARTTFQDNGPICWWALRLIHWHRLLPFMSKVSTQATEKRLRKVDLVVFMQPCHYDWARKRYQFKDTPYAIWGVPDVSETAEDFSTEAGLIRATEKTFEQIKGKVDALVEALLLIAPSGKKDAEV
jgi:protein-tyrosine-phosphatase